MRKLKLQIQMSIDGFVCGPNGEMDFLVWDWDEGIKKYVMELTDPVDTILLGRKMADGFVSYWEKVAASPDDHEYEFGKIMNDTPRIVFSKTLDKSPWNNVVIAKGELIEEVNSIKNREGGDIIVYGGASFVSSLIANNLIDDYYLFVNPSSAGNGLSIFNKTNNKMMKLLETKQFDCGIVLLYYKPKTELK